jgi:oligosaccharide repeat unit polymerase
MSKLVPVLMKFKNNYILIAFCLTALCIGVMSAFYPYRIGEQRTAVFLSAAVFFILSLAIMQNTVNAFNLRQLTIPGFFYITYLIMIFFPAFFIAADKPESYRYPYLFSVSSVLLTVPLGIWAASTVFRFNKKAIKAFYLKPILEEEPTFHTRLIYGALLLGALMLVLLYIREVETIPLFLALKNPGAYSEIVQSREEAFKLLESPLIYPYAWLRTLIFPLLMMLSLGYYFLVRQRIWLLLFFLSLVIGVTYAAFSMAKMPVASVFLILVLFLYIYKSGHIKKKYLIIAPGFILGFPFVAFILSNYGSGYGLFSAIKSIIRRLFYVQAYVLYNYFEVFPARVGHLYGRSIGRLADLMGWEYFNTANYVFHHIFPHGVETGQSNTAFIGNLHADFGIWGVIFGGLVTGFLIQTIQIYILRKEKTILSLAIYSFMIYAFWLLNITALPGILLSYGVLVAIILLLLVKNLEDFLSKTTEKAPEQEL